MTFPGLGFFLSVGREIVRVLSLDCRPKTNDWRFTFSAPVYWSWPAVGPRLLFVVGDKNNDWFPGLMARPIVTCLPLQRELFLDPRIRTDGMNFVSRQSEDRGSGKAVCTSGLVAPKDYVWRHRT